LAELAPPRLEFDEGCPDPGRRAVDLPVPLPDVGDDFDWDQRDYDSFRAAMLEELAVRFPERRRWTVADVEVVLVEAFAAVLDQLSDMADRAAAEAYLETARRPETVYRWLRFIGLELADLAASSTLPPTAPPIDSPQALLARWEDNPHEMELARRAGPGSIRRQRRMASLGDYADRLEEHPLVRRTRAVRSWEGAWTAVRVTVSLFNDQLSLDTPVTAQSLGKPAIPDALRRRVEDFHRARGLLGPIWGGDACVRDVLQPYIDAYRSGGQEVLLKDVQPVGVDLTFCIELLPTYFQSEVEREARRVLGRGPGGFFESGRLRFGEDLRAGDFYERLMGLDGVRNVELLTFKKVGSLHANQASSGVIVLDAEEIAVCDNASTRRARGLLRLQIRGGRRG
jgi:hypothetical protein